MDRHRRRAGGYVCGAALLAAAALAGCAGEKREEFPLLPQLFAGESGRADEIIIEIVTDAGRDAGPDGLWDEREEVNEGPEAGPDGLWDEREEVNEGPEAGPDGLSDEGGEVREDAGGGDEVLDLGDAAAFAFAQAYPGEVLRQADVEAAGEDGFFVISAISDSTFRRMEGNSYRAGCPVSREDLRYLRILHYDFSGNIRVGELVCHESVSLDMKRIFRKLYEARYPIERVALIDDYGGDDDLSSQDNNTSCFNYRTVAGTDKLSLHGLGVAIDVNPLYNPYITWNEQGEPRYAPSNGAAYGDRSRDFPYKIDEDDLCCRLFTQAGFTWGGRWEGHPDYMHFSRGLRPET